MKGPAAATLYGTEAARGVINIITKKGAVGQTSYQFTVRGGNNVFQNAEGASPRTGVTSRARRPACQTAPARCSASTPSAAKIHSVRRSSATGTITDYDGNVSGGSGMLAFFAAGTFNNDQGVDPTNEQRKNNVRTNLNITPSEKVNIQTNLGYVYGRTTLSCEAGCGGLMWDSEYSNPANLPQFCAAGDIPCTWVQGFNGTPPKADAVQQDWQDLNRITVSATINYNPFSWFSNRLAIGTDVTQEGNVEYVPYLTNDTIATFWGANAKGYRYQQQHQATYNTYDYNGSLHFNLPRTWTSKTTGGVQYYTHQGHLHQRRG